MSFQKGDAAFDDWTWGHMAAGAALGLAGLRFKTSAGLLVGYEVLESGLRRIKPEGAERGVFEFESWANIITDVIVGVIGYGFGYEVRERLGGGKFYLRRRTR